MNKILEISNLSKQFDKTTALKDVSFSVERGSICGLLGPNGAGKTTLLRIINGILYKDAGTVLINGKEASLKTSSSIGYMPEERGLYDKMTVEDQILYFGELKGGNRKRLRETMHEYLTIFNMTGNERRKIKELSKGNQQKVQIIATLVHEPELVILDEPFSGFDPINGALLQQLLERLNQRDTTIILSSHNMPAIEEMCNDIALINHGQLLLSGRMSDIKEQHKTNDLIFTTRNEISLPLLLSTGLISEASPHPGHKWRKGYAYKVKKNEGVSNDEILTAITMQAEILHFEEALPTLNEIFLRYTTHDNPVSEQNGAAI